MYQTFATQLPPTIKIDSASSVLKIDNLDFYVFDIRIHLPNNMTMTASMFCRLFGKREFSVNIMYLDEKQGKLMMDAWKKSNFE